ncbi:hypothetical protein J437_LFUL015276 [Ladona fulva]|uniref:Large ribosomal subunit protein uL30m n=1 Tax=Ladona fulva TaxID=123851 RepID=A0A8K0KQV1_LADFU|nr:hypothetical protein J437_LFUL015276 [Ladona fulva]
MTLQLKQDFYKMWALSVIKSKPFYSVSNCIHFQNFTVFSVLRARRKLEHDSPIKCHGFTYYPRFPDQKDPPYEPSKLFMVQRLKPLKGTPYWEKSIMRQLKLDGRQNDVVILKNIPENNARLWKVKHLVRITPIKFPNGMPEEKDIGATFLKENGELIVSKRLNIDPERLEVSCEKEERKMDPETIRKQCRLKWLSGWQT